MKTNFNFKKGLRTFLIFFIILFIIDAIIEFTWGDWSEFKAELMWATIKWAVVAIFLTIFQEMVLSKGSNINKD